MTNPKGPIDPAFLMHRMEVSQFDLPMGVSWLWADPRCMMRPPTQQA